MHSKLQRERTGISSHFNPFSFVYCCINKCTKCTIYIYIFIYYAHAFGRLEEALETSRTQLEEYEHTLSQRASLIKELHTEAEIHRHQLGQLAQLQTELSSAKEMSEVMRY